MLQYFMHLVLKLHIAIMSTMWRVQETAKSFSGKKSLISKILLYFVTDWDTGNFFVLSSIIKLMNSDFSIVLGANRTSGNCKIEHYADDLNYWIHWDNDVTHFVSCIFTYHSFEITVRKMLSSPQSQGIDVI